MLLQGWQIDLGDMIFVTCISDDFDLKSKVDRVLPLPIVFWSVALRKPDLRLPYAKG